ncbi:HNH endonuclease [Anaerosalibacter bizertensis]|uniref:HNH endonuclease n=1 Tax=Anaerosalibacter bizertensis TaxID=932217 RepID=A0A844FGQ3_9FIRM|nr:HNH endonuclease [Anaerosalibacter bizertensis]MSS43154.1 HNH endonuclease [Anaerosalibacter bizertensis]
MIVIALKKLCRCGKVIDYNKRYCDDCRDKYKKEKIERNRYYDKHIRDKKATSFYNSTEWIKTREYILNKYKGLDLYAFFILKEIIYADTVHHIVELKEDWNRRLDLDNLIPLNDISHKKIHGMYLKDKEGTQRLLFELIERWEKKYGRYR